VTPRPHPLIEALEPLIEALELELVPLDEVESADIVLRWKNRDLTGVRLPNLHNVMNRLIARVEREMGKPFDEFTRAEKQRAVRMLDEFGAFNLRKGVEDVADVLGVSRFTVYNYLNAIEEADE